MVNSAAMQVSSLHIYPVKSCAGVELSGLRFDARGPQLDRRWMLIDADGRFVTQREAPGLARVRVSLAPTSLVLDAPDMPTLKVPLSGGHGSRVPATVWGHATRAEFVGEEPADWFSDALRRNLRLVRWAEESVRPVSQRHTALDSQVAFADGYPVLIVSEASLTDLNARLQTPVPMDRFRPNIVVSGCDAFAEDGWRQIRLGDLTLDLVKPCDRCSITTVDQNTGDADRTGSEPLRTLATYRKDGKRVLFGQNAVHHAPGMVRVGDAVELQVTVDR